MTDHESSPATRGDEHHGYDAVVLAGGAARRLGGADKPGVRVGGRALLDRVLAACSDAGRTVVVADPRPTGRPVRWAREEPPGGGPLAALAAGLEHTAAEVVVVLSADLPFLGRDTVRHLVAVLAAAPAPAVPPSPAPDPARDASTGSADPSAPAGPGPSASSAGPALTPDAAASAPDAAAAAVPDGAEAVTADVLAAAASAAPPSDAEAAASATAPDAAEAVVPVVPVAIAPDAAGAVVPDAATPAPDAAGAVVPDAVASAPDAAGAVVPDAVASAPDAAGAVVPVVPVASAPDAAVAAPVVPRAAAPHLLGPGASGAAADDRAEAVVVVDGEGRRQPLVAAYRATSLRRVLAEVARTHGGLTGLPLRRLTESLRVTLVRDPAASFDCDTWEDIDTARARIREHEHVLDEWITAAKDELGIDLDVDTALLLDLARDAAHGVARPAAPLTTFLVGYAAGRAGGDPEAVADAVRKAVALTQRWAEESAAQESAAVKTTDAG